MYISATPGGKNPTPDGDLWPHTLAGKLPVCSEWATAVGEKGRTWTPDLLRELLPNQAHRPTCTRCSKAKRWPQDAVRESGAPGRGRARGTGG